MVLVQIRKTKEEIMIAKSMIFMQGIININLIVIDILKKEKMKKNVNMIIKISQIRFTIEEI